MKRLLILILAAVSLAGCSSTKVTRTSSDEVIDLSGRWNDTDSRLTAEEIVSDCLSRPWIDDFLAANGEKPVVIVGTIRNKSSEHIEVLTFVKDIERELINSGRVRFVASKVEREEVREEREDQQSNATEETAKALAAETGADYMMQGVITSITDAVDGKRVIRYQVSMELVHLQTNEKAWIGSNEVRKFIKQSKSKW
ncbi:MAG: penicillin-binding protein activator LpoB [Spirochaetales bacterium]|nr:penicillin-binding protein activator LpoB [Spirochaetales bacterium]